MKQVFWRVRTGPQHLIASRLLDGWQSLRKSNVVSNALPLYRSNALPTIYPLYHADAYELSRLRCSIFLRYFLLGCSFRKCTDEYEGSPFPRRYVLLSEAWLTLLLLDTTTQVSLARHQTTLRRHRSF